MTDLVLSNRLLRRLPAEDFAAIRRFLEPVQVSARDVLVETDAPITYVYFPETCVISILAGLNTRIEVGMVGFEGVSALAVVPGDSSPFRWLVQIAGAAWRIRVDHFQSAFNDHLSVSDLILRFHEALAIQFAFTALAHGSFNLTQRLARWLLMSHDRARRESMPHVHEFIASMLAVRRSGVSAAIHDLKMQGVLCAKRGEVQILDRTRLIQLSAGSYGIAEAEYDRLMAAPEISANIASP